MHNTSIISAKFIFYLEITESLENSAMASIMGVKSHVMIFKHLDGATFSLIGMFFSKR